MVNSLHTNYYNTGIQLQPVRLNADIKIAGKKWTDERETMVTVIFMKVLKE